MLLSDLRNQTFIQLENAFGKCLEMNLKVIANVNECRTISMIQWAKRDMNQMLNPYNHCLLVQHNYCGYARL